MNRFPQETHLLLHSITKQLPRPVKNLLKVGANYYFERLLGGGKKSPDFIVILAHMRSGSSLLAHLLMNHPAILGGGERNQSYTTVNQLEHLRLALHLENHQFFRHPQFVLDQINHTRFFDSTALLNHPRVRPVFLIRSPAQAISSMVRTFEPIYVNWSVERAAATYIERLNDLKALAHSLEQPAFFLTYQQLVTNAEQQLAELQQFLGLDTPFETRYKTWSFTGKRGDPSKNIASGVVLPPNDILLEPIEANLLDSAQAAYDACFTTINQKVLLNPR